MFTHWNNKIFLIPIQSWSATFQKIAIRSSPGPAQNGFSLDPIRSSPDPCSSLLVIDKAQHLWNLLLCMFTSTCIVQKVCVCTMDFVSADKNTLLLLYYCLKKHNKHTQRIWETLIDTVSWNPKTWIESCEDRKKW